MNHVCSIFVNRWCVPIVMEYTFSGLLTHQMVPRATEFHMPPPPLIKYMTQNIKRGFFMAPLVLVDYPVQFGHVQVGWLSFFFFFFLSPPSMFILCWFIRTHDRLGNIFTHPHTHTHTPPTHTHTQKLLPQSRALSSPCYQVQQPPMIHNNYWRPL